MALGLGGAAALFGPAALTGGLQFISDERNRDAQRDANNQSIDLAREQSQIQKEFAQNGIRWKVADAVAAGLHPLAALGGVTSSYTPVSAQIGAIEDNRWANMGQNISRAIAATRTAQERRLAEIQLRNAEAVLDGHVIDNQIRAHQLKQLQSGPAMPSGSDTGNFIPGQGNSGLVVNEPQKRTVPDPQKPNEAPGWNIDKDYSRTESGLMPQLPKDQAEIYESDPSGLALWMWRHRVLPNINPSMGKPSRRKLPKGARDWRWDYSKQEWQPDYKEDKGHNYRRPFGWMKFGR